jgi:hypothetical protein
MSLFALPVAVNDLTQLQLGIELFTNTTEATTEQGLITNPPSTPTVYSYAVDLLAKNISLSQVAMAVSALMEGGTIPVGDLVTPNTLTLLSRVFLPSQVSTAVANGYDPTVYAAEALGLALAGYSNAFATDFGSLSVPRFASEVASLTGINSGAIQGFVDNWIKFYTANPSATFGLSATLASYGAAFGDAVGTALANPTANGSIALLVSEVQNALIDNAEGSYKAGIALIAEPPHLALQGEALLIPDAGGGFFGPTIDWKSSGLFGPGNYAQFIPPAQTGFLTIKNAPSTFTLNTQDFGTKGVEIDAAGGHGNLFTLILGDSSASETLSVVDAFGYSTVHIIVAKGPGTDSIQLLDDVGSDLVISGSGFLSLGQVDAGTITDNGVSLELGFSTAEKIDASNAPFLVMDFYNFQIPTGATVGGVTVLGGTGPGNILQGSIGQGSMVTFSNGSTGESFPAGPDNFTGGSVGGDLIRGYGGPDTITLPNHFLSDTVVFGEEQYGGTNYVLAITDGMDVAYPGSWGASATATAIPNLFPGNTGGTSTDMTVIHGFQAGSGDVLEFKLAAWNGDSAFFLGLASDKGDLVGLNGAFVVPTGAAQLSAVWVNSGSNSSLKATDDVLLYAPSDASVQNAQQLAAQLHTSSDAIVLPKVGSGAGIIGPGQDKHILVAYDASFTLGKIIEHVVNIADVDLVNTSSSNQTSTANLHVYASDMVSLTGVSLASLTSANIHFI